MEIITIKIDNKLSYIFYIITEAPMINLKQWTDQKWINQCEECFDKYCVRMRN